jgi:Cu-processing system ATP-binding protein
MIAVETVGLTKRFGSTTALKELGISLPEGRITAVLGPNGSGKTTLIKCILGLIRPSHGTIRVFGEAPHKDPSCRNRIGYLPQKAAFPPNLRVGELVALLKELRQRKGPYDEDLFEAFGLSGMQDKPLQALSGGFKQRLSASLAFLFDPKLLILDEPTVGLDPIARSRLTKKIREACRNGKTILLSSHIIPEVEALAESLVFLLDGKAIFTGELKALLQKQRADCLDEALLALMGAKGEGSC